MHLIGNEKDCSKVLEPLILRYTAGLGTEPAHVSDRSISNHYSVGEEQRKHRLRC